MKGFLPELQQFIVGIGCSREDDGVPLTPTAIKQQHTRTCMGLGLTSSISAVERFLHTLSFEEFRDCGPQSQ